MAESELEDSDSEAEEEQLEVMEKVEEIVEAPLCKGNSAPPLASGNKGNRQSSARPAEEV